MQEQGHLIYVFRDSTSKIQTEFLVVFFFKKKVMAVPPLLQ